MNDLVAKKASKLGEFYQKINSLVNSKGGIVVIHAEDTHQLGMFDEKVDDTLCDQITTGALYQHVFRRFFYDEKHILYEVKAVSGERPLGALEVYSKTSLNKGKAKLSYLQAEFLLGEIQKEGTPTEQQEAPEFYFGEGEEVYITVRPPNREEFREPFQESSFFQAKEVSKATEVPKAKEVPRGKEVPEAKEVPRGKKVPKAKEVPRGNEVKERNGTESKLNQLVNYCWGFLPEYISAFTKSENGGSVFFGVREEKTDRTDKTKVWFKVSSVYLPQEERKPFEECILNKVKTDIMWVGTSRPDNCVEVIFRDVTNAEEDHCVIEVKMHYYKGFCFYKEHGLDAYKLSGPHSVNPSRVEALEWLKSFSDEAGNMKVQYPLSKKTS